MIRLLHPVLFVLAMVTIMAMAYRHGRFVERQQVRTACEKAMAANDDGRLAMMCDDNRLFIWRKADGVFVGAVDFRREPRR